LFAGAPSRGTGAALRLCAGAREGGVLMTDGCESCDHAARTDTLVHLAG